MQNEMNRQSKSLPDHNAQLHPHPAHPKNTAVINYKMPVCLEGWLASLPENALSRDGRHTS